jgi:hypothetical protein
MVFVPAASSQENLKTSNKPSELEKGLIDTLNSNTKNLPAEYVIENYGSSLFRVGNLHLAPKC